MKFWINCNNNQHIKIPFQFKFLMKFRINCNNKPAYLNPSKIYIRKPKKKWNLLRCICTHAIVFFCAERRGHSSFMFSTGPGFGFTSFGSSPFHSSFFSEPDDHFPMFMEEDPHEIRSPFGHLFHFHPHGFGNFHRPSRPMSRNPQRHRPQHRPRPSPRPGG